MTVSQTNGPVAGFFLNSDAPVGTFKAVQAGTAVSARGVMHTMPHPGANGVTTFQAARSASDATGVRFTAYALSANGATIRTRSIPLPMSGTAPIDMSNAGRSPVRPPRRN